MRPLSVANCSHFSRFFPIFRDSFRDSRCPLAATISTTNFEILKQELCWEWKTVQESAFDSRKKESLETPEHPERNHLRDSRCPLAAEISTLILKILKKRTLLKMTSYVTNCVQFIEKESSKNSRASRKESGVTLGHSDSLNFSIFVTKFNQIWIFEKWTLLKKWRLIECRCWICDWTNSQVWYDRLK